MLYITQIKFEKIQSLLFFNESTKAMSLQNGKIILARFIWDFVLDHKTGRSRQYGPVIVQSLLRFPFFFSTYLSYISSMYIPLLFFDATSIDVYTHLEFGQQDMYGKWRQILCLRVIGHAKYLYSKFDPGQEIHHLGIAVCSQKTFSDTDNQNWLVIPHSEKFS